MLAVLYLVFCAAFGICFVGLTVPDVRRLYIACSPSAKAIRHIPNTLFTVPAGIVTGMMCVPFFNYFVTLGLSYIMDSGEICKKLGVLITFAFFLWMILTCLILINRKRMKREELKNSGATTIEDYKFNIADSLFYGIVILAITVASTFLMFYTYRLNGNTLLNGSSTFSDLSPHTAMVSSFGKGFNFPTQYMHFSGDGIRYHFLFYFLAGTLQYLGLPIDYALNLPSVLSMVCALVLLGLLAVLISSRRAAFLVAPVLVFFRSSLNVYFYVKNLLLEGLSFSQAVNEIFTSSSWYAVTDYDSWGIWAINVYPNQRHLMLGIAVILVMVILFIPFVRRLGISVSRAEGAGKIKTFAFSRNAWLTRSEDPLYPVSIALLACILVITMPYFHGSCLIALLLVLFGMAVFSESRLVYAVVAVCAIGSSYLQTMAFSGGYKNVVSFVFEPGFILEDITFYSLVRYLFIVTGFTLILAAVFAVTVLVLDIIHKKPVYRFLIFLCFLNPMIFAFLFKVSLEMLANHKFIQVSLILVDSLVAALIANLLYIPIKRRKTGEDQEGASSSGDIIEAESADSELALAVAPASSGIRTPSVPVTSAFGEPITDNEERKSSEIAAEDIEAADQHTGIDADILSMTEKLSDEARDNKNNEPEKESEDDGDEIFEVIEENVPEELLFGDGDKDTDEDKENEDAEAAAGVAAIAALFGEDSDDNETAVDTKPVTDDKQPEESVITGDNVTEDTAGESDDSDDSDEAVMAAASEPAHIAMRPGNIALVEEVTFGEDMPDDESDAKEESVSDNEVKAEDKADEPSSVETEKDDNIGQLTHEPVRSGKTKGVSLGAWIALEIAGVILAIALMVPLTATGISEWATYINLNRAPLSVNAHSPVTRWIIENTDPSDAFLTPTWSMNRFILSGRPMYYGWPYYAWSAGHDTYTRDTIYLWLVTGCGGDINEFTRYCKERHIRYLIADPEFDHMDFGNGITFNREFFEQNLVQVAYFAEENTTIYRIY